MRIEEIMSTATRYKQTAEVTPYRDEQLARRYVTLKEKDGDLKVAVSTNGNYATLEENGDVADVKIGAEAWMDLTEKDFERWSPIRILRVEKIKLSGGKDAARRAEREFEATVKDLEAEEREEAKRRGLDDPVRPAWVGGGKLVRAFSRNGLEIELYDSRGYRAELSSRRRFSKEDLPDATKKRETDVLYVILKADGKTVERMGRNLSAAIRAAESDVLAWIGDDDATMTKLEMDGFASA